MRLDDLASRFAGKTTQPLMNEAIGTLIAQQEESLAILRSMKRDVDALVQGPFRTGMDYLREATLADRGETQRIDSLAHAREELMSALSLDSEPEVRAEILLALAVTWLALGNPNDARRFASESADNLGQAVTQSGQHLQRRIKRRSGAGWIRLPQWQVRALDAQADNCQKLARQQSDVAMFARALGERSCPAVRVDYASQWAMDFALIQNWNSPVLTITWDDGRI